MSTGTAARRALYGKMSGDTGSGGLVNVAAPMLGTAAPGYNKAIYSDVGPGDIPDDGYPFVVFFQTSGVPIGAIGPGRELENDLWTIKAVDRHPRPTGNSPGPDPAEAVQDRLDALLTNGTISLAGGGTLCYLRRESDVNYSETHEGTVFFHRGCVFRLIWQ